jgi:hypothetical protein
MDFPVEDVTKVLTYSLFLRSRQPGELVKIKLALERLVPSLVKISRHDRLGKRMRLFNGKGPTIFVPGHYVFIPLLCYIVQHLMEFDGKQTPLLALALVFHIFCQ